MKKLMIALVALTLSLGAMAQNKMKMKNGVMMKNGKMMMMKDGKTMMMEKDMTMSNGAMVMMDGSVKMTKMKKDTMDKM